MKKRLFNVMLTATLTVCLSGLVLFGCGDKKKNEEASTVNTEINADEYEGTLKANAEVYKKYITVPEYKGITVDLDLSSYVVNDDTVKEYIDDVLESMATTEVLTEGQVSDGDTIVLDYEGTLDGEAFAGGTATDVSYTVGSGKFIEDLDRGLVGLTVGVETEIPCTFPETYTTSNLAGKAVIFTVTVKEIDKAVLPELTDTWVAENREAIGITDESVKDVASFTAFVRNYLEEQNEASKNSAIFDAAYKKMIEDFEPSGYPEAEFSDLLNTLNANITKEFENYGSYSGVSTLDDYLTSVYGFESREKFDEYADGYAKEYLLQKMIVTIVAVDNEIAVTADDINAKGEELAQYYGYENYEEILNTYGKSMNAEIGYQVLYQKIAEFISSNVTVNNTAS